ncbi:hypothetical protein SAMN04489806_1225 [Paramicrobacterium humi]|uniref:Uncharacterized protein n=1 Tax=Paramicrobacterium humi TaxID=640635 RepID=A0A1H4KMV0_9MICO|nr:hypothetical protein [Microbacterium humi]SEB59576.1 hypothetical protein SAMN04489806_1225 [Microbacterium humi]
MSVSLLLVPLAFAVMGSLGAAGVAGAASVAGSTDEDTGAAPGRDETELRERSTVSVRTRMKDPTLLGAALEDLGARQAHVSAAEVSATLEGVTITMTQTDGGIWAAHFTATDGRDVDAAYAAALVGRLDAAYAARVQQAVAERIRSRADAAGFDLVSETRDADDTVTMVLNVKDYA